MAWALPYLKLIRGNRPYSKGNDIKMTTFLTIIGIFCLWSELALGQTSPSDQKPQFPMPKVQMNSQNELEFIYAPDRVAVVAHRENTVAESKIRIQLRSSSCHDSLPKINCQMSLWSKHFEIRPIWKLHPNPERVGQVVQMNGDELSTPPIFYTQFMRHLIPSSLKNQLFGETVSQASNSVIQCLNTQWLPESVRQLQDVSFETIATSLETDLDENKTLMSLRNVHLDRNQNSIEFSTMSPFRHMNPLADPVGTIASQYAELMGWTFRDKERVCQYSFERETNLNNFIASVRATFSPYRPFVVKNLAEFAEQLNNVFGNVAPDEYEMRKRSQSTENQILIFWRLLDVETITSESQTRETKTILRAQDVQ